jgi:EAL domain-containing protein (putative c-di-GMP-specific phosphodiesterase class I)
VEVEVEVEVEVLIPQAPSSDHSDGRGEAAERKSLDLLRLGLREDRFTFAYQSIASLEGDDTEHYDVLLRLVGEQGELLYPRDFIETAQRHGLTRDIDRLVVRKILELQTQRRERGARGIFFVRLSDATLNEAPAFLEWLGERVDELHSDFGELGFGLTEDSLRSNVRRAQQLAEGLRKLGFHLTIESFGATGKSTQLLERITADFAKLDAAVTEALAGDENDPKIVAAVQAARDRNISLIAQQVGDANTMARLWQIGINYIQNQFVQEPDAETVAGINAV